MASNLTLEEVKELIKENTKKFTNDFELFLAKRKLNTRLDKRVTFCLKIKQEDAQGEKLFDALQTLCIKEEFFVDVQTDLLRENTVYKELYFISAIVKINIG